MAGSALLAADLCRFMLALDPSDSGGFHLLLMLDHFLVAAGQHSYVKKFAGIDCSELSAAARFSDPLSIIIIWRNPYSIAQVKTSIFSEENKTIKTVKQSNDIQQTTFMLKSIQDLNNCSRIGSIEDLPNWAYSLALSFKLSNERIEADRLLKSAMMQWPFMLQPIVSAAGIDTYSFNISTSSTNAAWKIVFSHPLFSSAMLRWVFFIILYITSILL
jgi:hypothetical protein